MIGELNRMLSTVENKLFDVIGAAPKKACTAPKRCCAKKVTRKLTRKRKAVKKKARRSRK
jgi:hypothetical protein